ncbi:MAG: hypothetical protein P8J01_04670 [Acidimicrobiales bacterium]|nr:hypothetical protein [Acidimicrobiales bacterium]MDG1845669.1 hypothetical protein [Acidimicrobiales bacterium]|tara:strand:- start:456 stop:764 length:309 start_codon:yes stop_codon:yes gene_type:complete
MFNFWPQDPIGKRLNELKDLLLRYGKQEIRDPLTALLKWTAYGLIGLVFVTAGIGYLALGSLRLLQAEIGFFSERFSFIPYLMIFSFLLLAAFITFRSIRNG